MRQATRCVLCERDFRTTSALRRHVEQDHVSSQLLHNGGAPHQQGSLVNGNDDASDEDRLNTLEMAEAGYGGADRPYKCDKCRVGYTKQV